jgi:hypothetical protein
LLVLLDLLALAFCQAAPKQASPTSVPRNNRLALRDADHSLDERQMNERQYHSVYRG